MWLNVRVTAYNSDPGQTDSTPFTAAWGDRVHPGMIAISRDLEQYGIGRGTQLRFAYRLYKVGDRMHKRKRRQVDIWMESYKAAKEWGVQWHTLRVVDPDQLILQRVLERVKNPRILV